MIEKSDESVADEAIAATPRTPEEEEKEAQRQFEILKQRMTRTS